MKLKICGITEKCDIPAIVQLNPDYLGFIFHPASPRDISKRVAQISFNLIPKHIGRVAVFVDEPTRTVISLVEKYGFTHAQLHGSENPQQCREIQRYVPVIKAFMINDALPLNLEQYQDCCAFFLFDTRGRHAGGNGRQFNHSLLSSYYLHTPFFLSGGIAPGDASYLNRLSYSQLHAVDINSRFEDETGSKNIKLLNTFVNKLSRK